MSTAFITRRGGGAEDINNAKTKTFTALERIEENQFVERKVDVSIKASSSYRQYLFPGTKNFLREPKARTLGYGLSKTSPNTTNATIIKSDGTTKTISGIEEKISKPYGGYLTQLIPVGKYSFIAVYSWSDAFEGSSSGYANRKLSIKLYVLNSNYDAISSQSNLYDLNLVGATNSGSKTYAQDRYPYNGLAVTAVFPSNNDKFFALAVMTFFTWSGSSHGADFHATNLIKMDFTSSMTSPTVSYTDIYGTFPRLDIGRLDEPIGSNTTDEVNWSYPLYQPYSSNGIYDLLTCRSSVASNGSGRYEKGLHFLRIEVNGSSKTLTMYPDTLIDANFLKEGIQGMLLNSETSGTTTTLTFIMPLYKDISVVSYHNMYTIKINTSSKTVISNSHKIVKTRYPYSGISGDGESSIIVYSTTGGSTYLNFVSLGIYKGFIIGIVGGAYSYYSFAKYPAKPGIIPIFIGYADKDSDFIDYKLTSIDALTDKTGTAHFLELRHDVIKEGLIGTILMDSSGLNTQYVELSDILAGVIPAKNYIDGISKEAANKNSTVEIQELKG